MPTTMTPETHYSHVGESRGCADHDRDLIHELSKRLDFLWRVDQYIANAESDEELQGFWREIKKQEARNCDRARTFIKKHVERNCF